MHARAETIFLLLNLLSLCPLTGAQVSFSAYPVGTSPTAIAVGDFNGDGKPDLAVANSGNIDTSDAGNISILIGKGNGTFGPATSFNAGKNPWSIAVGDFNHDGQQDLAVLDGGESSVSILFGKEDGSFQPPVKYNVGSTGYPEAVEAADLNSDGNLDLAVANGGDSVIILLGNSDGTFQPAVSYSLSGGLQMKDTAFLTIRDFNGDGKLDIAAVSQTFAASYQFRGFVSVLLGNGDGTFQSPIETNIGGQSFGIAAADFNGDGKIDIIVAPQQPFQNTRLMLLPGNGDGTFGTAQDIEPASPNRTLVGYMSPVVGDFNKDGKPDVAVLESFVGKPLVLQLLLGNGDGSFQGPRDTTLSGDPDSLAMGDFNHDGFLDLAIADREENEVNVLINTQQQFNTPADFSLSPARASLGVQVGEQTIDEITVAPRNGPFASAVQLTCAMTGPAPMPTCSLSPSSVTPGANSVTSTLTITASATAAMQLPFSRPQLSRSLYAVGLPLMFGIGLVGGSKTKHRRYWVFYGLLLLLLVLQAACGGSNNSTGAGTGTPSPTNYTVTVAGASGAIEHTTQVAVTVQ